MLSSVTDRWRNNMRVKIDILLGPKMFVRFFSLRIEQLFAVTKMTSDICEVRYFIHRVNISG